MRSPRSPASSTRPTTRAAQTPTTSPPSSGASAPRPGGRRPAVRPIDPTPVRAPAPPLRRGEGLKATGAILLISCYELGHQPLSLAFPLALLKEAGYRPAALDLSVERLDPEAVARARFVGIAVPMHTALRLGLKAAARVRALNPDCHLGLYGLYAALNADTLLACGADSIIGGECEEPLLRLV